MHPQTGLDCDSHGSCFGAQVAELIAYNFEMTDACTDVIHFGLISKHVAPEVSGLAPSPPPPPESIVPKTCEAHAPWVHGKAPQVANNVGGVFAGTEINQRTALYHGEWTIFLVVASADFNQYSVSK